MSEAETRLEAQPASFMQLSFSQKLAAGRMAALLSSALKHSSSGADSQITRTRNNIILLSGGKGSGKTTVQLTLSNWCQANNTSNTVRTERTGNHKSFDRDHTENYRPGESQTHVEEALRDISELLKNSHQLHWLAPISLDALPRGVNLVAAVFARISHEASKYSEQFTTGGLLEPVSVADRALHELGSLRSDAVMALEGNLEERASEMDPESYAIAAIENERKRQEVGLRLNKVLTRLSSKGRAEEKQALYILPIDDLDSSPARAAEVMHLAFSLSVPRLAFILMGSEETADQVLFFQVLGEFQRINQSSLSSDPNTTANLIAAANTISSAALRKIVPPFQRIYLRPLSLEHSRSFIPEGTQGKEAAGLARKLEGIELTTRIFSKVGSTEASGTSQDKPQDGPVNLLSFLLRPDPFSAVEEANSPAESKLAFAERPGPRAIVHSPNARPLHDRSYFYDGREILRSAPRQLSDLYELLDRFSIRKAADPNHKRTQDQLLNELILDFFQEVFRPLVDEDGALTSPIQQQLKRCVELDPFSENVEMDPPVGMFAVAELGDSFELEFDAKHQSWPDGQAHLRRTRDIELEVPPFEPNDPQRSSKRLNPATRSSFKVLHDLIKINARSVVTQAVPMINFQSLARTSWSTGYEEPFSISWLRDIWSTFWHRDLFLRVWNRGLRSIRQIARDEAKLRGPDLSFLAGLTAITAYIEAATANADAATAGARTPKLLEYDLSSETSWTYAAIDITSFIESTRKGIQDALDEVSVRRVNGVDDHRADHIDAALISILLLLAPEAGIRTGEHTSDEMRIVPDGVGGSRITLCSLFGKAFEASAYAKSYLATQTQIARLARAKPFSKMSLPLVTMLTGEVPKNSERSFFHSHLLGLSQEIESDYGLFAKESSFSVKVVKLLPLLAANNLAIDWDLPDSQR